MKQLTHEQIQNPSDWDDGLVVYIIEDDKIVKTDYERLVFKYAREAQAKDGHAPEFVIRRVKWFVVDGDDFYRDYADAAHAAWVLEDLHRGERFGVAEYFRSEIWKIWPSVTGRVPEYVDVCNTLAEAEEWLFTMAQIDFINNPAAPTVFLRREDAEWFLYGDAGSVH